MSDVPLIHETTSVFTHAFRVAFDSATNRLHDKMGSSSLPEEIVCICSRQDFLAFPFSYTFSRPHSRSSITHEELDSYVAEAQKKAYDQAKNRWGQILLHDPRHMHLISSSIHTLEIDRKIVLHPIGHC